MGTGTDPHLCLLIAAFVLCHGPAAASPHGRPSRSTSLRPLAAMLLDPEQADHAEQADQAPSYVDAAALLELDQLFNAIHTKGKRGQPGQVDKGLTRDLITQVLQPGGSGMWFGPRLGRRRRSAEAAGARRAKRALHEDSMDMDAMEGRLAELIKELQVRDSLAPKRSHCDPAELNCILYNLAASRPIASSEQYQQSRSEGNLVNFTPRLGRESGEDLSSVRRGEQAGRPRQLHMDDDNPLWFSPRLGRRSVNPNDGGSPNGSPNGSPQPQQGPAGGGTGTISSKQ